MTIGPIQLVVLGFEEPDRFQGRILAELEEVRGRDVVRRRGGRGAALVEALRDVAEVEVVRALVAAGVLEDSAAPEAVEALVAAGLVDPAVVQAADAGPSATDVREA